MSADTIHPVAAALGAYYHGQIVAPSEAIQISDHLAGCAECRGVLQRWQAAEPAGVDPLAGSAEDADRYEDLVPWVEEEPSSGRPYFSPAAEAELADLRAFHAEMAALPPREYLPEGPVSAPGEAAPIRLFPSRRTRYLWAAAAVLLLTGWLALERWPQAPRNGATDPLLVDSRGQRPDLAALPENLRAAVETAAKEGKFVPLATVAGLRPVAGVLAGPAEAMAFRQIGPIGEVVRNTTPTLRWQPLPGAAAYVVTLQEVSTGEILTSPSLSSSHTSWTPAGPLRRGALYAWQVDAYRGDDVIDRAPKPPAPESRFVVLSASGEAQLADIEHRFAGYPLIRGVAYARAGLRREAADMFARLAQQQPDSVSAQRLRAADSTPPENVR